MRSQEMVSADVRLAHAVLAEQDDAFAELIARVGPIVRARIRKVLARVAAREQHDPCDLEQEVYLALFRRRRRVIGAWDPERGLALANFVGLFAERAARSLLRRRSGARERCLEGPHFELLADARTPERRVAGRQQLECIWRALARRHGSLQISLVQALLIEDASTKSLCNAFGMTPGAVYQARNRVVRALRRISEEVDAGLECSNARRSGGSANTEARFVQCVFEPEREAERERSEPALEWHPLGFDQRAGRSRDLPTERSEDK